MYIADLHIHSKYSRATSRECIPEYLDLWARKKGIDILGTGDFTHPAWRQELVEKLEPAEEGLYVLKEEYRLHDGTASDMKKPRFVVTGEISSIYKKNGKVRKVHNLILLPGLEDAKALSARLEAIGNIHSDGRPILGLDSRDLLEITLEASPRAVLVPAHIWTPHFSLFGAFSGFDTIEECFGDLTPHIHALETGLSSDPPMNWRLSALDSYQLISNSDAHSPSKLGREANLLDIELSYEGLTRAVQTGKGLYGTIEFYPEEGKYHLDGHRKCGMCLTPLQTEEYGGLCPVCQKKITIGVLHRIEQLADRGEGYQKPGANSFESLVPLPEVIASSLNISAAGKKANQYYEAMLAELGDEFSILRSLPLEDIRKCAGPCIEEGIRRLRAGEVERIPGFDGEYGKIHIIKKEEMEGIYGQLSFGLDASRKAGDKKRQTVRKPSEASRKGKLSVGAEDPAQMDPERARDLEDQQETGRAHLGLNELQYQAAVTEAEIAAVVAGPGTGKTRTLAERIFYLMDSRGVKPSQITAVTFTNKAAQQIRERAAARPGQKQKARWLNIGTFHGICLSLLKEWGHDFCLADEFEQKENARRVIEKQKLKLSAKQFLEEVSRSKNGLPMKRDLPDEAIKEYCEGFRKKKLMDFDDLLTETLNEVENNQALVKKQMERFRYLLVDEFQDINALQYRLLRCWSRFSKSLFVIGDPDQSIYGFRGADFGCLEHLKEDYPRLCQIKLTENYRSTPEILSCAVEVISKNPGEDRHLIPKVKSGPPVRLSEAVSALSEGIFIAKEINRMTGGMDMMDAQNYSNKVQKPRSFGDIAVLYRTHQQAALLEKCLRKESIPYVVIGKDTFLEDRLVRGTILFFRYLSEGLDARLLKAAIRNLWECGDEQSAQILKAVEGNAMEGNAMPPEDIKAVAVKCMGLTELFLPVMETERPGALLERWMQENGFTEQEHLTKLRDMAVTYKHLKTFLADLTLGEEGDCIRIPGKRHLADSVKLLTLHGSKGLEFPVVFLCGINKRYVPIMAAGEAGELEEERRLFYVGMTRAGEELILSTYGEPSPFLKEMDENKILSSPAAKKKEDTRMGQLSLFDLY